MTFSPPFFVILFVLVSCAGAPASGEQAVPVESVVAFTNVNVISMADERVLRDQTVLVRDDTVAEIGPSGSVALPAGARRIDGKGGYLLPGLTDFHVHLRSTDEFASYLAHGVTTIVHMSGAMGGAPDLLRYREEIAQGDRLGPTLFTTGPILDGDPPIFRDVSTVVTTPEEARRAVAGQHEAGYDLIKVYNNLEPEVLTAAVDAAHEREMAVVGHIPRKAGRADALQRALHAGLDVIAHGEEYFFTYFYAGVDSLLDAGEIPHRDEERFSDAVRLTREAGASIVPNLSFVAMTRRQLDDLSAVLTDPESPYLAAEVRAMWETENPTTRGDLERFDRRERAKYAFLRGFTERLSEGGVPLLLGTDASAPGMYPGASAHLELRESVAAGLSPYEALATGTRNAGAFIEANVQGAKPFGRVAPGQQANLLLVQANPLETIANASLIDGVMVRGKWLSRAELDRIRNEAIGR